MSREEIQECFVRRFSVKALKPTVPAAAEDILRVEKELKTTFPKAYFSFITHYGPVFTPSILDLVTGGDSDRAPKDAGFDVREFFVPDQIVTTHHLCSDAGMDDWLIPVAMDCMGNVFGFRRAESNQRPDDDPVFLFDHDFCKTHQEADSFDGWLASFLRLADEYKA